MGHRIQLPYIPSLLNWCYLESERLVHNLRPTHSWGERNVDGVGAPPTYPSTKRKPTIQTPKINCKIVQTTNMKT